MRNDLPDRVQSLYDRLKAFPEIGKDGHGNYIMRPEAFVAFLDLRQLIEREVIPALHEAREFVAIRRLEE